MRQVDGEYLDLLRSRYRKATKKGRTLILDEYARTTGYHRKYAIGVLGGKRRRVEGPIQRPRRVVYGDDVAQALLSLSELFDGICSRRLRAAMDVELPRLHASGHIEVAPECYEKLMRVSHSTIDRLLAGRRTRGRKARAFTKPGTLLKHRIPIRTWADWTENQPGFCEMDLVDHRAGASSVAKITPGRSV